MLFLLGQLVFGTDATSVRVRGGMLVADFGALAGVLKGNVQKEIQGLYIFYSIVC